jgi:hypothetical protein
MPSLGRIALASGVCLVLGCGASSGAQAGSDSAGAASASAGSDARSEAAAAGRSAAIAGASGAGQGNISGGASVAGGGDTPSSAGAPSAGEAGAESGAEPADLQEILDNYRSFAAQTLEPVSVSSYIFGLCRLPTLRESEFLASIHGNGRYLRDWANEGAAQGIASKGAPAFPVGAVIVKEKYAGPETTEADLVAIALMIKRAAGFDVARGDWDYAYYEPALGIVYSAEQSAYCADCHAGAAATDYVFVDGLKP